MAGKAAVLYFFDEECPKCVEAWPKVLFAANKFEGQPVLFIAVNSGTARSQLEGYLRKNKVTWPQAVIPFEEKDQGFQHPLAKQYGLLQVPTNFLVEDGKVVATQIRGQALRRKVEELMGKGSNTKLTDRLPDLK